MKKDMPLEGLRWSRDSGSTLCDTPQNGRSRTGWGGNFAQAKLTQSLHVLTSRRILSYFYMIMVAFFMLSFTACSSDEETEKSEVFHYETTFLAHEWQISALYQRVGSIFIDVKEAPLFCRMRTGS